MLPLLRVTVPLLAAAVAAAVAVQGLTTTLSPDCPASCGGVNIPYPFGVGPNCARKGFEISCSSSTTSPPVLANTSLRVLHLSVDPAQSQVMLPIGYECYNFSDPTSTYSNWSYSKTTMNPDGVYRISNTHNMFVVLGCNTQGFMVNKRAEGSEFEAVYAGCMTYCNNSASAQDGLCAGVGCCRVDIPPGLTDNYYNFKEKDHTGMMDYSPCDYAFLVDRNNYTFARSHLKMDVNHTSPVWLDWAIRDASSCAAAAATTAEYACKSHLSNCTNSINGPGYICKCRQGYKGNAYLTDGCTDINECDHPDQYPCINGVCKNTQGSYECKCRPGYHSVDPKTQSCTSNFPLAAQLTIGIILGVSFLAVSVLSTLMIIQKKRMNKMFKKNGGLILQTVESLKIYDKEEIKKMTKNHSDFLGKGSFGKVYKGTLPDNTMVAVKESIEVKEDTMEEFTKEVLIQSKMIHRNILKLFGCCLQVDVPMLVYEFAARGSLRDLLHGGGGGGDSKHLPLDARLDIAIGAAEGLRYMHLYATQAIRHGDVKPDNILLDDKLVPKISDFGLSQLLKVDEYFAKVVVGCMGYIDPVFIKTGLLTQKSDVYSFGAVLLELVTRKPNVYDGNRSLIMEFRRVYDKEGSGRAMFDADIAAVGEDVLVLEEISKLAIECLHDDVHERPDMAEVAERLMILRRSRKLGGLKEMSPNESPSNSYSSEASTAMLLMSPTPTSNHFYGDGHI